MSQEQAEDPEGPESLVHVATPHPSCLSAAGALKVRYHGRMSALGAASRLARLSGRTVRVYRCPGCRGWHTTTHPPVERERDR
jgi:hypothetical protein